MTPEELQRAFETAENRAASLQVGYAQAAQAAGHVFSVLSTTKPYWLELAAQSGNNITTIPILESGKAVVTEIGNALQLLEAPLPATQESLRSVSLTASFFGSNTAATSSLVQIDNRNSHFHVETIPVPDFSADRTLAIRFSKLDPALGQVCAEIWENLYGTIADPERSALYMVRQTWDHLFDRLAPDQEVRNSTFWKQEDGEKPDLVTREERFMFAVDRHVKDPNKKSLLSAACTQMLELYQELNRAHKRGPIDKQKARQTLNSMYSWLMQLADALNL